jgi:hypothetical protein
MPLAGVLSWNMRHVESNGRTPQSTRAERAAHDQRVIDLLRGLLQHFRTLKQVPTIVLLQEAPHPAAGDVLRASGFQVVAQEAFVTGAFPAADWVNDASVVNAPARWGMPAAFRELTSGLQLSVSNVHLPSRMHAQDGAIELAAGYLREDICHQRTTALGRSEVVAGDFNLTPDAGALMHPMPKGLGANRCRRHVGSPRQQDPRWRGFLNASWSLLGKTDYPLASYYYAGSKLDGPWYQYDQILLSPDLVGNRQISSEILVQIGNDSLITTNYYSEPDKGVGSDHLPVMVRLR